VPTDIVTVSDLRRALRNPVALEDLMDREVPHLTVDLSAACADRAGSTAGDLDVLDAASAGRLAALPLVLVGVGEPAAPGTEAAQIVDVAAGTDTTAAEAVRRAVATNPIASVSLALLLRQAEHRSIAEGLAAESAVYSMLQAGPEFATWRREHPAQQHSSATEGKAVRVKRTADTLHITLSRPLVHNAFNSRMRDELHAALMIAASDPSLSVLLTGDGPSFCSGGDLHEFGSRPDPGMAHLVRLRRSIGLLLATLSERVEVILHGSCLGAGIELPAFAGRVTAQPGTTIALPEVSLGLIPGAGGTVSITRRIGRHRTAYLALSGDAIGADAALRWGLVDEVTGPDR
jgi:enoyl-CoA hydratase/carnithine racemase